MMTNPGSRESGNWAVRFRALANIPPFLKIVWASGPTTVSALVFLRILAGTIPLAMLSVGKRIIDTIVLHVSSRTPLGRAFWWYVTLEFSLAALGAVLGRAIEFCDGLLSDRYVLTVSVKVMEHTSRLDLACYEDASFHDKLERARVQGTDRVGMIPAIGRMLQEVVTAVTLILGTVTYSFWLVLILLAAVAPAFFGDSYFAFRGYMLAFRQTPRRRELDYVRHLAASKETAKELRLFGLSSYWTNLYRNLTRLLLEENIVLSKKKLLAGLALSLLSTCGYYAAYILAIHRTVNGQLTVGALTFLAGSISGISAKIHSIFTTFSGIADQSLFLKDLFDIFNVKPKIVSNSKSAKVPIPVQNGFEFRGVFFSYPGGTDFALRNLNFSIRANERIALVGNNGSGKTTIVKLLTRLYDPTAGQILLDGVDLREYSLRDLHRQIAVIFQDFVRYDRTASQNIGIGDIEAENAHDRITSAAEMSSAHQFISRLPLGYEQIVGRRFDGGVDLSGGEWQRLALARAFFRKAQLLILDEPSAALDPDTEFELLERFDALTSGKMALLISHRFSTVRIADRILVLENGNVVEQGSHSELVAHRSRYSKLFEMQALHYR
jgi:ATP-binding cassette subfamily B protein